VQLQGKVIANKIVSPDAVFGLQNCSKIFFALMAVPRTLLWLLTVLSQITIITDIFLLR